jgi:hypothetical protein
MIKIEKIEKDFAFLKALFSLFIYALLIIASTWAVLEVKNMGFLK